MNSHCQPPTAAKMIGPNDKRRKKSRCAACAGRRIKCERGFPCAYCTRNGHKCLPPTQNNETGLVVVQTYAHSVPQAVSLDLPTKLAKHFFSVFMTGHDFVGNQLLDIESIATLCQGYQGLQSATMAIAALDASRRSQVLSPRERRLACISALKDYRTSLMALRKDLDQKDTLGSDEAYLWTTFFLGIFELMYDVTGDGWVKHIHYGTSKLLQIRGPLAPLSDSFRSFFLSVRVYEICRALIFNDGTFLDEPDWKALIIRIWEDDCSEWHPKEDLFDLMVSCASLNMRVQVLDHEDSQPSTEELCNFANEGLQIQESLHDWLTTSSSWVEPLSERQKILSGASNSILAKIYYHAITIFLSGIFDYRRPYWTKSERDIHVPTLHQAEVQQHVSAILETTENALKTTTLVGLLFFFPLRVAGARARIREQKAHILELFQEISRRNFIVASAFIEDLVHLWGGLQ